MYFIWLPWLFVGLHIKRDCSSGHLCKCASSMSTIYHSHLLPVVGSRFLVQCTKSLLSWGVGGGRWGCRVKSKHHIPLTFSDLVPTPVRVNFRNGLDIFTGSKLKSKCRLSQCRGGLCKTILCLRRQRVWQMKLVLKQMTHVAVVVGQLVQLALTLAPCPPHHQIQLLPTWSRLRRLRKHVLLLLRLPEVPRGRCQRQVGTMMIPQRRTQRRSQRLSCFRGLGTLGRDCSLLFVV